MGSIRAYHLKNNYSFGNKKMFPNIVVLCFFASYLVAVCLEIFFIKSRFGWHRLLIFCFTFAGFVAHTMFLANRTVQFGPTPLASPYDWYMVAAWLMISVYIGITMYEPRTPFGVFLLPLTLGLIGLGVISSTAPFSPDRVSVFWGSLHGMFLLLGTTTVFIGFFSGVMYLIQSSRLKSNRLPLKHLKLPSLEWLERVNSRTLVISVFFIGIGVVTGVLLGQQKIAENPNYTLLSDPIVLSMGGMLLWLVVAEGFRLVYPAARQGRKVAYLTVASVVFLMISLASLTFVDGTHGRQKEEKKSEKQIESVQTSTPGGLK